MIEKIVAKHSGLARVGSEKPELDLVYLHTLLFQRIQIRKKINLMVREVENIFNFEFKNLRPLAQRQLLMLIEKLVRSKDTKLYFPFIKKLLDFELTHYKSV
ncbi:MAG: hypothetical protein GF311_05600 [Candidatus Lokiarchaeota archaeon]|nr:hypothetical protein [Candidatus Lokiarchaeota archaeon]